MWTWIEILARVLQMRVEIASLKVEFGKRANEYGFILYKFEFGFILYKFENDFILYERECGLESKS